MTRIEMQPNIMHVNPADKCNMKNGTADAAGHGAQEIAATVEISTEGSKKALSYVSAWEEKEIALCTGETVTERSFESLMDAVLCGEDLSEEEQERLNGELLDRIRAHYNDMSNLQLSAEDERILEALKKNFRMKQQALRDMEEAEARQKLEEETTQQAAKDTQNANEAANKIGEVNMLNQTLEGMEQDKDKRLHGRTSDQVQAETGKTGDNGNAVVNKAAEDEEQNKANIQEIAAQREKEALQEKEYSVLLDESFKRVVQVFEDDGYSLKDRAETYLNFKDEAEELAVDREIARHLKIYDYETELELKIKSLSGQGAKDVGQRRIANDTAMRNAVSEFVKTAARNRAAGFSV